MNFTCIFQYKNLENSFLKKMYRYENKIKSFEENIGKQWKNSNFTNKM